MVDYCLPPALAAAFKAALQSGRVSPSMAGWTSAARKAEFGKILGDDHAEMVNALFEEKMLAPNFQRGLQQWVSKLTNVKPSVQKDMFDRIAQLDPRILNPMSQQQFLHDLAKMKLGMSVNSTEARQIFTLSQAVQKAKAAGKANGWTKADSIAYGDAIQDLTDYTNGLKPVKPRSWGDIGYEATTLLPKAFMTSILHFSAFGVQLLGMAGTKQFFQGVPEMFKFMANKQNYRTYVSSVIGHPDYKNARAAGLRMPIQTDRLTDKEEILQSNMLSQFSTYIADKTKLPDIVKTFSNGWNGAILFVRFQRYTEQLAAGRMMGLSLEEGSQATKDLAHSINVFTGAGSLGPFEGEKAVKTLNAIFFAPRVLASVPQVFDPRMYLKGSPIARINATKQFLGATAAFASIVALMNMTGNPVSTDPRNTRFAKVKIGNEEVQIGGHFALFIRAVAQATMGQVVNSKDHLIQLGEGYKPETRMDIVMSYFRGKLAALSGAIVDGLVGRTGANQEFTWTGELRDKFAPIFMNTTMKILNAEKGHELRAILPSMLALFGVEVSPPLPPPSRNGRDVWGDKLENHDPNDPVEDALNKADVTPHFAEKKLRGVPLDPQQYDDFLQFTGRMSKEALTRLINQPGFKQLQKKQQAELIKDVLNNPHTGAREAARQAMMTRYPEILDKANDLKIQRLEEQENIRDMEANEEKENGE